MLILAINPGSTSTKISVYKKHDKLFETTIKHSAEEIKKYEKILDQYEFRRDIILKTLSDAKIDMKSLNAVVARGGLLKPIESGTYKINDKMLEDLRKPKLGEHASNLGAFIAKNIADPLNIASFIVDPVVVDEFEDVARISGFSLIERRSIFHALNQKSVGRLLAKKLNKKYEELRIIIAHMGGGVSVGAHKNGRVIDVTNALDGEGSFSPERSGTLPAGDLVRLCFSGKYTETEMMKNIIGSGGVVSYCGTNSMLDVSNRAEDGDTKCKLLVDAMCYQTAKDIGAMATVLHGKVDAIAITGGIARDEKMIENITNRVSFIAEVHIFPGEEEMFALTEGCIRAMEEPSSIRVYQ